MGDVFTITRPSAKKETRFVGKTKFALRPGESLDLERADLDPQAIADVIAGEFTSDPAMVRDEVADEDPVQRAVNGLVKTLNLRNTDLDWEVTPVVGGAGVLELEIAAVVLDTDHANSPRNHACDGLRVQLDITAGSAEFDEVGGGQGPKIVTFQNGRAVAKLVVGAAITEAQTVAMTDVDTHGLSLPVDATVNFNS